MKYFKIQSTLLENILLDLIRIDKWQNNIEQIKSKASKKRLCSKKNCSKEMNQSEKMNQKSFIETRRREETRKSWKQLHLEYIRFWGSSDKC